MAEAAPDDHGADDANPLADDAELGADEAAAAAAADDEAEIAPPAKPYQVSCCSLPCCYS